MSAPATISQPSRKSKKAWRKNVDIEPVTQGLDAARKQYIQTGGHLLADAQSDALFQTDTAGDAAERSRQRSKYGNLKADQIIAARSKVPAVSAVVRPGDDDSTAAGALKRKRGEKLSYRELERLKKLARERRLGHRDVVEVKDEAEHDPWAAPAPVPEDPNTTFLKKPQAIREPVTLRKGPQAATVDGKAVPNVRKPNAGRSYNPKFEDWSALLEQEGEKEVEAEQRRRDAAAKQQEREEAAARSAREAEEQENEDTDAADAYESEWEGFQSEAEASDVDAATLKAKRPQRKTPQERNKIQRRKKAEALERHESRMRQREQQEKNIAAVIAAAKNGNKSKTLQEWTGFSSDVSDGDDGDEEHLTRRPRFGKRFSLPEKSLDLVLPEELQDSLRGLKPEGNLLKDRFRNYILQGKVEARRPAVRRAAKNRKETELWSYKDWKLPNEA